MELDDYQRRAYITAIYPRQYKVTYPALALAEEAGEVAGLVGKSLRDENGKISEERKAKIKKELGDVLWQLSAVATDLDFSLNDIASTNLEKLESRQKRGKLKGDGDDR